LRLPLVNFKPVLHPPIETALLFGNFPIRRGQAEAIYR
jgi:hypothetical protein